MPLDATPYGRQQDFEDSPPGWPQKPTSARLKHTSTVTRAAATSPLLLTGANRPRCSQRSRGRVAGRVRSSDRGTARCRTGGESEVVHTIFNSRGVAGHAASTLQTWLGVKIGPALDDVHSQPALQATVANGRESERRKGDCHALYDCGCSYHIVAPRAHYFLHHGRGYPYSSGDRHHHDPGQSPQRATRVMTRCPIQDTGFPQRCLAV